MLTLLPPPPENDAHSPHLSPPCRKKTPPGQKNSWLSLLFFLLVFWGLFQPGSCLAEIPGKAFSIGERYALALLHTPADTLTDAQLGETVLDTTKKWQVDQVLVAWVEQNASGQSSVTAIGETAPGNAVHIVRASSRAQGKLLEKMLAFPTSPDQLNILYLENEIVADDQLKGKPVIFTGTVAEIGRGAFNKPYIFFPVQPGTDTGLTCYFDAKNTELRKVKKGTQVLVRGQVKGFLMQDVILERCEILAIRP